MIDTAHRNTALLVAGCYFTEMLDGTIVTTASPQIGRSPGAPPAAIGLVVTAYLLTLATAIPLSGWLTRRLGNRIVFLTAIAVFTLASIGCAASVNLGMLVGMRVLQGAGGAMMVPVGRTMVMSRAAKEDLLRVTSYVVWPALLAPAIAPVAGGLITTYASLHWMFLINAPLGVIAFCVAWRLVRDGRRHSPAAGLDRGGADLPRPRRPDLRRAPGRAARAARAADRGVPRLAATSTQLAGGLAIAVATGAAGRRRPRAGPDVAFGLLALIAAGDAAGALRMDRTAGDAARRRRTPAASAAAARD